MRSGLAGGVWVGGWALQEQVNSLSLSHKIPCFSHNSCVSHNSRFRSYVVVSHHHPLCSPRSFMSLMTLFSPSLPCSPTIIPSRGLPHNSIFFQNSLFSPKMLHSCPQLSVSPRIISHNFMFPIIICGS